ncbi:MAG: orotidine-5'-phosphate decarboxylase [Butyricicoccaceae bacterium]
MNRDVIIACDFKNKADTMAFLDKFQEEKPFVKIGMELFYGEGPDIVRAIKDRGHKIFLDLKLHDIPNTVNKAMRNLARLGVDMTNVHAAGTIDMMKAALEGLAEGASGERALLIAVTQLTSTSEARMQKELLIGASMEETVAHYARNTKEAGLDGVVCSPLEAAIVKGACGRDFITVTPGIRYPDGNMGDQSRVMTPAKARETGTEFIVVGRPITQAEDVVAAYRRVCKDFIG